MSYQSNYERAREERQILEQERLLGRRADETPLERFDNLEFFPYMEPGPGIPIEQCQCGCRPDTSVPPAPTSRV